MDLQYNNLGLYFLGPRKKKKRNLSDSNLFVSAEEVRLIYYLNKLAIQHCSKFSNKCISSPFFFFKFGHLLDENMGSKFDNIGMNAMANKDNASK